MRCYRYDTITHHKILILPCPFSLRDILFFSIIVFRCCFSPPYFYIRRRDRRESTFSRSIMETPSSRRRHMIFFSDIMLEREEIFLIWFFCFFKHTYMMARERRHADAVDHNTINDTRCARQVIAMKELHFSRLLLPEQFSRDMVVFLLFFSSI